MNKTVSTSKLRKNLSEIIRNVKLDREDFILITKRYKPVSAIINIDFLETLLEAVDKKYLESIKEARKDYEEGRVFNHEEIFGRIED